MSMSAPAPFSHELTWRLGEADASPQFMRTDRAIGDQFYDDLSLVNYSNAPDTTTVRQSQSDQMVPKPRPSLTAITMSSPYNHLGDERIACIGAGPSAIVMASYLVHRGVDPENITLIDPRGKTGGIWNEQWVQTGGFNNPKALEFPGGHYLDLADRGGDAMRRFIRGIGHDYLSTSGLVSQRAVDMRRRCKTAPWEVTTRSGNIYEADSVILAPGAVRPRQIDGSRIKSNLDTVTERVSTDDLIVERYQRKLADHELNSGRPIVLMGLGNSTAAMLNQIQAYEDEKQIEVDYYILTDLSARAMYHPTEPIDGRKPVFRNPPEDYFTGYSGDLLRDRDAYFRALGEGRIIPDVGGVEYDEEAGLLRISDRYGFLDNVRGPHVFALLGYERNPALFRAMGAFSREWPRAEFENPQIRPCDGAVHTKRDGYMSNVFTAGAAAATPQNPNAAIIPGVFGQAPSTTVTIATRNYVRSLSG